MSTASDAIQEMIDRLEVGGFATQLVHAALQDALVAVVEAEDTLEPRFPLRGRYSAGERVVVPGSSGSYPDHSRDQWGYLTEIRRVVETTARDVLMITFDGETEARPINSDVVARGTHQFHRDHDPIRANR